LWLRLEANECVDVLVVDEAAQMSLANVLAVSQAAPSLVLLGDPQQLEQPLRGSHPEGTEVSALHHHLKGAADRPDCGSLAPCRISIILALEIQAARRETERPAGDPQVDPGYEPGQPALGHASHLRRTAQLGIDVGQTSVAKYMARRRGGPSRGWRTFLRNHADGIVSMDLFVVPTLSFRLRCMAF
jgi:hypothetical protein